MKGQLFTLGLICFFSRSGEAATITNTHDSLNRLTNAAYSDGSRESYSLDPAGNRTFRITSTATVKVDTAPPSVPTNVVLLSFTNSQLLIGWNRAFDTGGSALAGYQVFVNGSLTATTTSTSYLLTGLLPATQYCLTVAAVDRSTNISAASLPVCITTPSGNDTQPPLIVVLSPANNAVFFTNLVSITGTATDAGRGASGIGSVMLNNIPASGGAVSGSATSQWNLVVSLLPGYNPFRVVVSDASTNQNRTTNDLVFIRAIPSNEPPSVVGSRVLSNNQFETTLAGNVGTTYGVWASTNLFTWTLLTNVTLTNWVQQLVDTDTASYLRRFYRFSLAADTPTNVPSMLLLRTNSLVSSTPLALGDDGRFYGTQPNGVFCLESTNLNLVWGVTPVGGCSGFPAQAVSLSSNGIVVAVGDWNQCDNGRLVAFDSVNGAILWQKTDDNPHPRHVPAINDAVTTVFYGTGPSSAVNYLNAANRWTQSGGLYIGDRGIALDASGNLYVGSAGGAGNPNTIIISFTDAGATRWSRTVPGLSGPRIIAMPSSSNLLLQAPTGLLAWNASTGADAWSASGLDNPVTDVDGNLYCNAVSSPQVVSLTSTGSERWRVTVTNTPSVMLDFIDANGILYARGTNTLYALSPTNWEALWTFTTDANIGGPAVLGFGGRIVLSDVAGGYYVLNTVNRYAPSSWPVAQFGNRRHTSKSDDVLSTPGLP